MMGNNFVWFDAIAGAGGLTSTAGPTPPPISPEPHPLHSEAAVAFGYWYPGDGGGGVFYWDASSTAAPDGGTVFAVALHPRGRWIRLYDGPINVRWFGAYGDGVTNDAAAINAALTAATSATLAAAGDGTPTRPIRPASATVYFPPGTYAVSTSDGTPPLILAPNHSGVTLRGATDGGQYAANASKIQLHAPASSLLQISSTFLRLEDLWLDGNQKAGDTVRLIATLPATPGGANPPNISTVCSDIVFERVLVTGAAPMTGNLVHFAGARTLGAGYQDSEIDNVLFLRCQIRQFDLANWIGSDGVTTAAPAAATQSFSSASAHFWATPTRRAVVPGDWLVLAGADAGTYRVTAVVSDTQLTIARFDGQALALHGAQNVSFEIVAVGANAGACVYNDNGQAFMINFDHGYLAEAQQVAFIAGGACHFRHCEVFGAPKALFAVELTQLMIIEDCYTEDHYNANPANPTQPSGPFILMNNNVGFSGMAPLIVRNCQLNTDSATLSLNCKQPVILEGNLFAGRVSISPAVPPPQTTLSYYPVISIGNVFEGNAAFIGAPPGLLIEVADVNAAGAPELFTNRLLSPVESYSDSATATYNRDGVTLAIANGATATEAGAVISSDTHWITGLTQDRTFVLANADLGSRMRLSRVGAGDSSAAIINNAGGANLITLSASAGQLGWADLLFVANNGWVVLAKGPA